MGAAKRELQAEHQQQLEGTVMKLVDACANPKKTREVDRLAASCLATELQESEAMFSSAIIENNHLKLRVQCCHSEMEGLLASSSAEISCFSERRVAAAEELSCLKERLLHVTQSATSLDAIRLDSLLHQWEGAGPRAATTSSLVPRSPVSPPLVSWYSPTQLPETPLRPLRPFLTRSASPLPKEMQKHSGNAGKASVALTKMGY